MSLEGCSSSLAALQQTLLQDTPFRSVPVGSEPKLHDFDALLATDSLGLDKFPLPYLSSRVPALLARTFQLSALVVVVCPIIDPTRGCRGCRFSMSNGMMTGHSSSSVEIIRPSVYPFPSIFLEDNIKLREFWKITIYAGDQFTMKEAAGKRRQPARNSKSRRSRRQRRFESKKHKE